MARVVPAEPCGASLSPGDLRSFLELGVAQLESAMKDADAHMASLSSVVSHIVARLGELRAAVAELPNDASPHRATLSERLCAMSAELERDALQHGGGTCVVRYTCSATRVCGK